MDSETVSPADPLLYVPHVGFLADIHGFCPMDVFAPSSMNDNRSQETVSYCTAQRCITNRDVMMAHLILGFAFRHELLCVSMVNLDVIVGNGNSSNKNNYGCLLKHKTGMQKTIYSCWLVI